MDREVLFLIIGLIGGAIISLFINYFTHFTAAPAANRFQKWRNDRAQKKARKSIEAARERIGLLENRLDKITHYANNPSAFFAYLVRKLLTLIFGFLLLQTILDYVFNSFLAADIYLSDSIFLLILISPSFIALFSFVYMVMVISRLDHSFMRVILAIDDFEEITAAIRAEIAELQEVVKQGQPQSVGGN